MPLAFRGTSSGDTVLRNGKRESLACHTVSQDTKKRAGTTADTLQPSPSAVRPDGSTHGTKINNCGIISVPGSETSSES